MANRRTKIEILGLGDRVQVLVSEGLSARRIAARLRNENPDIQISDASVARYVSTVKAEAQAEAFDTIRKHVDKTVPEDLKALEEMEAQALLWSREAGSDRVERMADAAMQIAGHVDAWRDTLLNTEDETAAVKKIIRICLIYTTREDRLQAQRIQAMTMATKIIDLKLRQAGLLDDDGKRQVIIMDRRMDEPPEADLEDRKIGHRPFMIPGGKNDG